MKIEKPGLKKCKKCGNKNPKELYYETHFSGQFKVATDGFGNNDDIDFGGYSMLNDFLDNMLVETGKRKLLGCDKCLK